MNVRLRLSVRGSVQGVGFRPFVYREAQRLGVAGWIKNDPQGVTLEAEGSENSVRELLRRVTQDAPFPARVEDSDWEPVDLQNETSFRILPSTSGGAREATLLADLAPCANCIAELDTPGDRRHGYPFTNCTHCGPRFTIILDLPYDRPNTTLQKFVQCPLCQAEYDDPGNRRFHAQPNACPHCGPSVRLLDPEGQVVTEREAALAATVALLQAGGIVAVQGVGGFQILVDATRQDSVARLRERKHRWEKPLAVMVPNLAWVERLVELDDTERAVLAGPQAPIVLLRRRAGTEVAPGVAPHNPYLGLMLPSSPLHHLLLGGVDRPVVATSGNLSEEPICITPEQAVSRLGAVVDGLLVHDRPIARHADDSVVRVTGAQPRILRRARGYAPLPILLHRRSPSILALGGHQKNTVTLLVNHRAFVSQHIGDLDNAETLAVLQGVIQDFLRLYEAQPECVACDLHPDYASTLLAERLTCPNGALAGIPRLAVQHHHAHLASCLAENGSCGPALGVMWDGSGLGTDRTLWGGEFLVGDWRDFERVGHLLPFALPGGEAATRSPHRIALSLLHTTFGPESFADQTLAPVRATSEAERRTLLHILERPALSPLTSSVGRLFDAVASLLDLSQRTSYEGQAAMAVEFAAGTQSAPAYPFPCIESGVGPRANWVLDPRPLVAAIVTDLARGVEASRVAARFHASLVESVVELASRLQVGEVALSGGCFQNLRLETGCREALEARGHRVLLHRQVPPNDGGLSLGQAAVAAASLWEDGSSPPT